MTSSRLVRGGRWVFRGTIVPVEDVFTDLRLGLSVVGVWEKYGTLDRQDLEAVVLRAIGSGELVGIPRSKSTERAA